MFYSADLLAQRENGFGLLWLAATLGSKSTVKKLTRRSILAANIPSLCDLIADPEEPHALRLSSNLMIGVTRVYSAKHEIFYHDVTTCHAALKKTLFEMRASATRTNNLQMTTVSARPETLKLDTPLPEGADILNIDMLEPFWADLDLPEPDISVLSFSQSDLGSNNPRDFGIQPDEGDIVFDPEDLDPLRQGTPDNTIQVHRNAPSSAALSHKNPIMSSAGHVGRVRDAHILDEPHLGLDYPSSDRIGGRMDLSFGNDDLFGVGSMGGEGEFGLGLDLELDVGGFGSVGDTPAQRKEMDVFGDVLMTGFDGLGGEHARIEMDEDLSEKVPPSGTKRGIDALYNEPKKRPAKRALIDKRIELTNEELQASRDRYDEEQTKIGKEMQVKARERDLYFKVQEMIWAPPAIFRAPELIDLWNTTFKAQVDAQMHRPGDENEFAVPEPPGKRRRVEANDVEPLEGDIMGMGVDGNFGMGDLMTGFDTYDMGPQPLATDRTNKPQSRVGTNPATSRAHSVATPEVGRRMSSRPPSAFGGGSLRSSLLPWDNPYGAPPSSDPAAFGIDIEMGADKYAEGLYYTDGLDAPPLPTFGTPLVGGVPPSLGEFGPIDVEESLDLQEVNESQMSQTTLSKHLERNSSMFLEYVKTMGDANATLLFSQIVPPKSSTTHVAAAGFYHCLVLATKDLVRIRQEQPFGDVEITVL